MDNRWLFLVLGVGFMLMIMPPTMGITKTITTFSDGTSYGNFSLTAYTDVTKYLSIPKITYPFYYSTFLSYAKLPCYQEYANISSDCGGLSSGNYAAECSPDGTTWGGCLDGSSNPMYPSEAFDGNYTTYTTNYDGIVWVSLFINYSKPNMSTGAKWVTYNGAGSASALETILPTNCFDAFPNKVALRWYQSGGTAVMQCYNMSNELQIIKTVFPGNYQYEEYINWTFKPENISVYVGGINTYNSGKANFTNVTLINSSIITDILSYGCNCSGCSISGNDCLIPFLINSTVNATVAYSNIYLNHSYGVDNCTGIGIPSNSTAMNVTFKNYANQTDTNVNLQVGLTGDANFSMSATNINHTAFCVYPSWANLSETVYLSYEQNSVSSIYSAITYLNNILQNILLYVQGGTVNVLLTVYNQNTVPLENVVVKILRYDVSTNSYYTTQVLTTDSQGHALANLVLNTVYYRFILERNGEVVLTEDSSLVLPSLSSACAYSSCKNFYITIGASTWFDSAKITEGVLTSLYYNNDTKNFVYNWNDPNNAMHQACLRVTKENISGNVQLTDSCTASMAGSILYNTVIQPGQTYIATGYLKFDDDVITDLLRIYYSIVKEFYNFGSMGLFWVFILSLVLIFAGLWMPEISGAGMALVAIVAFYGGWWNIGVMEICFIGVMLATNYYITRTG